ncbi:unnamed protein product [Mytilus edulis]|uniref:Mutator-like transposase domain-containing protein n=1 Tax=Mytilus edulis TaxID=6550 RepID=A0A8S3RHG1_MYTED|nr:unnamed protein product [Mytilus edulis]
MLYNGDLFSLSGTQEKKEQVPPGKEKADQTGMSILTKMQWCGIQRSRNMPVYPQCVMDFPNGIWKKKKIRGLGCREQMKCTHCTYHSKYFSLYEEIATNKPGRRSAKVNVGLAVGLSKTPMAASGYIRLCLSTNLPPPSARGIQDACNKILTKKEMNKNDMKMRRERIKQQNGCQIQTS